MKKYSFNDQIWNDDYKFIFLCGSKYNNKDNNKRNVLFKFIENQSERYRPIILERNFMFRRSRSRKLFYDDINLGNLYQVEMLLNYIVDKNIIIHESISTAAEIGLFLSEKTSLNKTCILVPDKDAVEEDKVGAFIRLAFLEEPKLKNFYVFYPAVENYCISDEVKYWHTFFYQNRIGYNLGNKISDFLMQENVCCGIRFSRRKNRIKDGYIHYKIDDKSKLTITLLPRVLVNCISAIFNIKEISSEIFCKEKSMSDYVSIITIYLKQVFINTIQEITGEDVNECSIVPSIRVTGVYISEFIGMTLYLFQAAGFISINKVDKDANVLRIERNVLNGKFFYNKYSNGIKLLPQKLIEEEYE